MENLKETVREVIAWYAGNGTGANMRLFKSFDDDNGTYIVTSVMYPQYGDTGGIVVLVRVVDDKVVIEEDNTDRPVEKRLMNHGIPREKIVLAYRGEPVPDPVEMI